MRATSRHADRHAEVVQQPAQLRSHGQNHAGTSGSPPLAPQPLAGPLPPQQGVSPGAQQPLQMGPSPAEIQQHLMANGIPPGMMPQQQQQQLPTNGSSYGGAPASMPMIHGQPQAQVPPHSGYQAMPSRPAGAGPRIANQNYAPTRSPVSGRTSPGLKRGYDEVQQSNASAAAAAAAFLSKQQQQADDKRMRMSH